MNKSWENDRLNEEFIHSFWILTEKAVMKGFQLNLYCPSILHHLYFIFFFESWAVVRFNIANCHIFVGNNRPIFYFHSSFHYKVETRSNVWLSRTCLKCLYLAKLVKNIPLWLFLNRLNFLFIFLLLIFSGYSLLFSKRINKTVLFYPTNKGLGIFNLTLISCFSTMIEISVYIRLMHNDGSALSHKKTSILNTLSWSI